MPATHRHFPGGKYPKVILLFSHFMSSIPTQPLPPSPSHTHETYKNVPSRLELFGLRLRCVEIKGLVESGWNAKDNVRKSCGYV